ncbi:hypothetical protein ACS0TY_035440 [Phlomoides rotata]
MGVHAQDISLLAPRVCDMCLRRVKTSRDKYHAPGVRRAFRSKAEGEALRYIQELGNASTQVSEEKYGLSTSPTAHGGNSDEFSFRIDPMHVMMRSPVFVVKFKNYETLVTNWKSVSSEADNGSIRTSKDLESASKLPPLRLNYLDKIMWLT